MATLGRTRADFPPGFLFGTAPSAYQIEGSAFGGAGPSHWDTFAAHLDAVRAAIAQGVNLRGFYDWSLLDNCEWAFGFENRSSLAHVDFESLKRTPKWSYQALTALLRQ